MTMRTITRSAVLLVLISVAAQADEWNRQFTVSAKPELQVNADDARVAVSAWDQNKIDVMVHTVGVKIPQGLQVTAAQTGNTVRVELHASNNFCIGFCVKTIEVRIQVPRNSVVDVRTSDGRIEANDLSGDLRLHSGDGHITGHNLSGTLNAETSDGHIEIDGRFEQVRLHSGDGHIRLAVSYGSRMAGDWSITTGDGSVTLELPLDLAADLDVHTSDGHIESDLPVEVQGSLGRDTLRGKLNGGGPRLEIRTSDGSIHLERVQHEL